MPYTVTLYDRETGYLRDVAMNDPRDQWTEGAEFLWTDGNWSCDCNRIMFLYADHDLDIPCGHDRIDAILPDEDPLPVELLT